MVIKIRGLKLIINHELKNIFYQFKVNKFENINKINNNKNIIQMNP